MMNIILCEDDPLYRKSLCTKINAWMRTSKVVDVDVQVFRSSEDLLEEWNAGMRAHLLLLDIEIPNELNGMELAKIIRKTDLDVPIVFITNYDDYVYQGYVIRALRYIKKPVIESDLFPCLDIAYHHYSLLHQERSVLSVPGKEVVLRYAEILYIEAHSPNICIFTLNLESPICIRYRLSQICDLLPDTLFAPCHRSYIVNLSQIRILKRNQLLLSNNIWLPVSDRFVSTLYERFNSFHQEVNNRI